MVFWSGMLSVSAIAYYTAPVDMVTAADESFLVNCRRLFQHSHELNQDPTRTAALAFP